MYGGIVFLLLSFVGVAKALTEQKTIKVSTATEFQEAVGDYTTIVLANDIIIPWQNSTQEQYGIHVQQRKGLVIEGNGFKLDGDAEKSVPPNYIGPPAMTVEQSDITINGLTVTNFGCFGGAITLKQGTTALISNSFLIKNVKPNQSCAGLKVYDGAGNPPCDVTLNNVTIDGNAGHSGGGISAVGEYRGDDRPTLTMIDCKVTNNIADYRGAGIYVDGAALFLKGVMFKDNVDKGSNPRKDIENDVYLDMNANCQDCWTSSIDISQCPEDEFKTIDEGSISFDSYPYGPDGPGAPVDPRSYSCVPK